MKNSRRDFIKKSAGVSAAIIAGGGPGYNGPTDTVGKKAFNKDE